MKLFALLATINVDATRLFSRSFVETYLKGQFSLKIVERSLILFDSYMEELSPIRSHNANKRITLLSVKILMICSEINNELHLKSKFLILISIIQFSRHFEAHSESREEFRETILDAVVTISGALLINEQEFANCRAFITEKFYKVPDRSALLVTSSMEFYQLSDIKHFRKEGLKGQFFFLKISQADIYIFYYSGQEVMELGGKSIFPNHIYVLPKGSAIKSDNMTPIYYGDIVSAFCRDINYPKISFRAEKIGFTYPDSDNGLHELSVEFEVGEMVGVMGGSGTGKSTLMRILNGTISPDAGIIDINGKLLGTLNQDYQGIMGFVPQDDLLIDELSVYENMYYNAKLCLDHLSEKDISKRIYLVLNNLGLFYIKDLKVGNPLNKFISGGQRKRLNIALELIREPYILFVDEPTSGLSSTDSENVLSLLKEQSLSGKIVIINIHQPSSDMFKLFDKVIIMDKGGYPVYYGNPLDSVSYLKNVAKRADAAEIQCETCGNVQTDDILKILEAKKVNEFGEFTAERVLSPQDWYRLFKERIAKPLKAPVFEYLPALNFRIPSGIKQFVIYSKRNFFTKLADKQFVILSLSIAPILAIILAFFTKYLGGMEEGKPVYLFSLNENIPAYLFMCVIVSLFIGLIVSAEEIIRDRKIRAREAFLNLSKYSYFNSKIIFLFGLSALQMFIFILLGNNILEIRGLNLSYWLILFSTSCFAVMLGLNISSGLKSVVSIYIIIPFILVPLILLSGVIVKYDKLHPKVAGIEYVPVVGDLMASRWAYEALVVNQFKNNAFEKHFFDLEMKQANLLFNINFLIPELKNRIGDLELALSLGEEEKATRLAGILSSTFSDFDHLPSGLRDFQPAESSILLMKNYLGQWEEYLKSESGRIAAEKENLMQTLIAALPNPSDLVKLKQQYHNEAVADLVLNRNEMKKILEYDGKLIRKDTPVFHVPGSGAGRSHFFSAVKVVGSFQIDTIWFNILVLWLMTLFLYIALVNNWLRLLLVSFSYGKKHRNY
ncbi:MAG: ATP-binding cassette domain-containing protein [Bacteroidales bacterium]